jgi:hypothetical protein
MAEQVVEGENVLAAITLSPEDHVRPPAHTGRHIPFVAAEMEPITMNSADEYSLITRSWKLMLREKRLLPGAKSAHALICRRPIRHLEE